MNYQVADFIIRLKNSCLVKRKTAILPYSKINKAIAALLVREQFLQDVKEEEKDGKKVLAATIRYRNRRPVFTDVIIVSKPSLRVYEKAKRKTEKRKRDLGTAVFSTSSGIMTETDAQKKGIGGELLFRIW